MLKIQRRKRHPALPEVMGILAVFYCRAAVKKKMPKLKRVLTGTQVSLAMGWHFKFQQTVLLITKFSLGRLTWSELAQFPRGGQY